MCSCMGSTPMHCPFKLLNTIAKKELALEDIKICYEIYENIIPTFDKVMYVCS